MLSFLRINFLTAKFRSAGALCGLLSDDQEFGRIAFRSHAHHTLDVNTYTVYILVRYLWQDEVVSARQSVTKS